MEPERKGRMHLRNFLTDIDRLRLQLAVVSDGGLRNQRRTGWRHHCIS